MKTKKMLLLFTLIGAINLAKSQNVDPLIRENTIHQIKRELKHTKNLVVKVKKKKHLKKACNTEDELKVFPIFWMFGENKDLDLAKVNDKSFFNNLIFESSSGLTSTFENGKQFDVGVMLFEALVYDTCSNIVAKYSESKKFYVPSLTDESLFRAIIENNITDAFYIINFDRNHPYFLVNEEKDILVYYYGVDSNGAIEFSLTTLEEYLELNLKEDTSPPSPHT